MKIVFEGSLRPVRLLAKSDVELVLDNRTEISHVTLTESLLSDSVSVQSHASGLSSMTGTANLTFSPGQTRVFNLTCIPREAGEVNLTSITLIIEDEGFDIAYVTSGLSSGFPVWWNPSKKEPMWKRIGKDRDTASCTILPKPPKIIITTPTIRNHYYTDEQMVIDILIENQEDETADLSIEVRLLGQSETSAQIQWVDEFEPNASSKRSSVVFPSDDASALTPAMRRNIGALEPTGQRRLSVLFTNTSIPLDYEVEISALYHLVSDADTPIFKTVTLDLSFIRPFEANYELLPRVHPAAWPDFFHHEESGTADLAEPQAQGLQQRWNLNSKIISFAHEPLLIEEVTVAVAGITGGVVRHVSPEHRADSETPEILPEQYRESDFTLELQRMALEDRQPTTLNLVLEITWRRQAQEGEGKASSTSAFPITRLPVPRFVVPMGEPRVLAAATPSSTRPDFIQLDYTLENPSMHFLTFNLNMEASDQFAFSGPKTTAVQLVPLSRHTVRYHLLSTTKEKWIQPQFLVVDSYYNKTLRVLPTEGMKADKKGILICTT